MPISGFETPVPVRRPSQHAGTVFVRTVTERRLLVHAAAAAALGLATVAAFLAEHANLPRSAAVVYVLGVTLVGALEGVRGGLIAAFVASLIYNFFFSVPAFQFSLTSAEDLVPLIVFILSAAASGLLTGWLKDRAQAAELASRRMKALFDVSRRLQAAVKVGDIPDAISAFAEDRAAAEIFLSGPDGLQPVRQGARHGDLARRLIADGGNLLYEPGLQAFRLTMASDRSGVVVLPDRDSTSGGDDVEAFVSLLSLTLERCLLLERVSEAELIRRSEEYKTALLSSVSHDLRTPLGAIAASASSLERFGSDLSPETRSDLLVMIREQCARLDRYTTNLLNLGRLQGGLDPARFVDCDVVEALGSAIGQVRTLGTGHRIDKDYAVATATVRADPVMLEQIFYNILENAVRYSAADMPIKVVMKPDAMDILVSIEDGGKGLPEGDARRIFERFYRGRAVQSVSGSGLGLSIAKGFVEAFGGTITASNAPGEQSGAVIAVRLPHIRSEPDPT
jgi:two-component system sensor histidine kinase KdpD